MQVAIVLYPGFTGLDVFGPYELLRSLPESKLRFVYHQKGLVTADSGVLRVQATHTFDETPKPDIILVPGSGTDTLNVIKDESLLQWLRQVHQTTEMTLSVCTGSIILAAAGILKDKPATTHWAAQDYLSQFGAYSKPNDRIVKAGKVITSAGVSAGIDLALLVVDELCGRKYAEQAHLRIEYDPQPHLDCGHPSKVSQECLTDAAQKLKENINL